MGIENIDSLKPAPETGQISDEIVIVPLLNKTGGKIGEAYFVQEPEQLSFRSIHIYGHDVVESLGLTLALTEAGEQCNVTIFEQEDTW